LAISPDTPPKATPDDTSYSAPNGGILASVSLQVIGDESGRPSLFMNLDDGNPNSPGSSVDIFTGIGILKVILDPLKLSDGFHGEGTTCVPIDCTNFECPPVSPTPTPATPTPTSTPPTPAPRNPKISLDMVTTGNTYDDTTNTMNVGAIDNCLTTAPPGDNSTHLHPAHLIIEDVADLVGWQVRLNYIGDKLRPASVNFAPFTDTNTFQNISFLNLPLTRRQVTATSTG